jgi:hypothetical protein
MKNFNRGAILIILSLTVSCGGSSDPSNETLDDILTGPSSVASQVAQSSTTTPPLDPQLDLTNLVDSSGIKFSTPVVSHSCGQFALVHKEAEPSILQWSGSEWASAPFSYATTFDPEIAVDQHWIDDVTGDGDPEIILNWYSDGGNRGFGQVISANSPECIWHYLSLVDGFGDSEVIDNLAVVGDGQLGGSGFIDGSGGRVGLRLNWEAQFGLFVAMPLEGEKFCDGLTESFDLPLSNCSEGWAVRMAQESLVDRGAKIDTDGQYGPATQLAVLTFQKSLGIKLTGQLDGETWASLFPAGSDEFPDYDGDGVSSPREIGHALGAFEYYDEGSGPGATLSPRVTVVRTYCDERRTALTSDVRGPLIDYLFVTEYSNGRKKIEVVGSSWSTLSGKCG